MRRCLICIICVCMMLPNQVCQAGQKVHIDPIYQNQQILKGRAKKKSKIQVQIGKKEYRTRVQGNGKIRLKIPKQKVGKTLVVKIYRGKHNLIKKKIHVLTKNIKVKKFSTKSKSINGYAKPGYRIKITMNRRKYTTRASKKKGIFRIKMKHAAGNGVAKVSLYNKKGKYLKSLTLTAYDKKKTIKENPTKKVLYTTTDGKEYKGKVPGLEDPMNLLEVEKQMNEASMDYDDSKTIVESTTGRAFMNATSGHGQGYYGWISYYMDTESDNQWQWYHAKNGITLYYIIAKTGDLRNTPTPDCNNPETYEGKITSGQTGKFAPTYLSSRNLAYLGIKIVGYKNGKPVIYYATSEQLMAGTIGILPEIQ